MTFISKKVRHFSVKLYVPSLQKQKIVYTLFRELIILVNKWNKQNSINQIRDKLKGFICTQNSNSNLHKFSKILFDNLIRKRLDKRIINQKADKLHSINQGQQIVEFVLLSPLNA